MRIHRSALLGVFFAMFAHAAFAACGPNALGTHRTIELDPTEHKRLIGKEKRLGLKKGEVILTFDDGPIARKTARILNALQKECVKATFFAVAKMAKYQPGLLKRIVNEGHTLGHHTYNHNRLPKYSVKKAGQLVDRGIQMVEKIAYGNAADKPRVPFFRYPYLSRTKRTNRMMARKGLIIFDANIDANDWKKVSSNTVHNRIMRRLKREKKGIILMHDIQNRTAKMLPRLLRSLKKGGYKVVHIVPPRQRPIVVPDPVEPVVIASVKPAEAETREEPAKPAKTPEKITTEPKVANAPVAAIKKAGRSTGRTKKASSIVTLNPSKANAHHAAAVKKNKLPVTVKQAPVKIAPKVARKILTNSITHTGKGAKIIKVGGSNTAKKKQNFPEKTPSKSGTLKVIKGGWKLRPSQWILR